jgi:hypothetical protein
MLINGVGATATAITLVVVLVAKFLEGAWVTLLLIPLLLTLFLTVRRHYNHVARELVCDLPLNLSHLRPPIVIVPLRGWNMPAHKALRFAFKLSADVYAVQVYGTEEQMEDLRDKWPQYVEAPAQTAGLPPPQLIQIQSPYRRLFTPLLDHILEIRDLNPGRQIAVIIPELVEARWYHYLMHNQRAEVLKTLLLLRGNQQIVVINVPWYLTG